MSPIALILNLLLGGLLVAALALGVRLDRRLRALRDSQAGFIKAVNELDQAAARTHAGLAQWRDATDEAREMLHDRIEKAKVQASLLERLIRDSATIPEPARPVQARPDPLRPAPGRPAAREPSGLSRRVAPEAAAEPVLDLTPRDARPFRADPLTRSRVMIDDDLFEVMPTGAARLQRDLAVALERRS